MNYFEFLGQYETVPSATAFYNVQKINVISHVYPQSCEKQYLRLLNINANTYQILISLISLHDS